MQIRVNGLSLIMTRTSSRQITTVDKCNIIVDVHEIYYHVTVNSQPIFGGTAI